MPNDMCFHHGYEPLRPTDFRLCGECHHVWRTRQEFHRDVRASHEEAKIAERMYHHQELNDLTDDDVWNFPFCPLCTHDWT